MMEVCHERAEFSAACERARGEGGRVGLVPTMGALHAGHLSLARAARRDGADFVALTIFVNPLQFAPGEDLDRYPRTLEADLDACRELGVDLVFAPARDAMYPAGFQTEVRVTGITRQLEGEHRPGHFDGVTTVVAKLFANTGRCHAYFGRKDFQQWRIVERMARDLDLPVDVVGMPIVREADGLALSSRNRYLSSDERERALGIARGLRLAHDAWRAGTRHADALSKLVRQEVEPAFDRIDYVALASPDTLERVDGEVNEGVLLIAAHVGKTRLIDNLWLGVDTRP